MSYALRLNEKLPGRFPFADRKDRKTYLNEREFNSKNGLKCDICFIELPEYGKKKVIVDHCHVTGKIRGVLCSRCNRLLGFANDNQEILISAASYLYGPQ